MTEHVKVLEQMRASGFDYDFDNEQYAALDAAIAALKAEKQESECPWGGCGDCVGHEAAPPAGDAARKETSHD